MLELKTSWILTFSLDLILICKQRGLNDNSLKVILNKLGILYQINDDFKNLFDNQYINLKGLYDDLNEQKLSFPVLAYLQSNQVSTTEKLQFLETF